MIEVKQVGLLRLRDDVEQPAVKNDAPGGVIARVGQRLIEGVARMSMDRFFGCLASKLTQIPTT